MSSIGHQWNIIRLKDKTTKSENRGKTQELHKYFFNQNNIKATKMIIYRLKTQHWASLK